MFCVSSIAVCTIIIIATIIMALIIILRVLNLANIWSLEAFDCEIILTKFLTLWNYTGSLCLQISTKTAIRKKFNMKYVYTLC